MLRRRHSTALGIAKAGAAHMARAEHVELPEDPGWPGFKHKFATHLRRLAMSSRGCTFCKRGVCQLQFAGGELTIRRWRAEFHAITDSQVQDRELCWLFWRSAPGAGRAESTAAGQVARCDTSGSDMETGLPSCVVAKAGPKAAKATPKAKVKAKPKAKATPQAKVKTKAKTQAQVTFRQRIDTSPSPSDGRINTSPSPSSDSDLDIVAVGAAVGPAPAVSASAPCLRRPYNAGRARQASFYMEFLGKQVCFQAARDFIGVGLSRLYRIKDGHSDGRSDGTKRARGTNTAPMMASVLQFLWQLYHSVGEGMPDKFSFERPGLGIGVQSLALA